MPQRTNCRLQNHAADARQLFVGAHAIKGASQLRPIDLVIELVLGLDDTASNGSEGLAPADCTGSAGAMDLLQQIASVHILRQPARGHHVSPVNAPGGIFRLRWVQVVGRRKRAPGYDRKAAIRRECLAERGKASQLIAMPEAEIGVAAAPTVGTPGKFAVPVQGRTPVLAARPDPNRAATQLDLVVHLLDRIPKKPSARDRVHWRSGGQARHREVKDIAPDVFLIPVMPQTVFVAVAIALRGYANGLEPFALSAIWVEAVTGANATTAANTAGIASPDRIFGIIRVIRIYCREPASTCGSANDDACVKKMTAPFRSSVLTQT